MRFWIVSMECAGIAEAGGVKNVTLSLCKELSLLHNDVTLFIPIFKCTSFDFIKNITEEKNQSVFLCGKTETVEYKSAVCTMGNFKVVFICHNAFGEKEGIYTYTAREQSKNPDFAKGQGHKDSLFMDTLFQKAVCAYSKNISSEEIPDIIHCQDAASAMVPSFCRNEDSLKNSKCVVTIHNAGPAYHHEFSSIGEAAWYTSLDVELLEKALNNGKVEPFLLAYYSGAELTTVSEQYAKELSDSKNAGVTDNLSYIFEKNNIRVTGITNGFDFERYNPCDTKSSKLPFAFNPEKSDFDGKLKCRKFFLEKIANAENCTYEGIKKFGFLNCRENFSDLIFIAYHGRLASQKGVSVLLQAIPSILLNFENVRFIIAGQGEKSIEDSVIKLVSEYEGKISFINGYNQVAVRLVTAVSDFIALPSFFEPCGLEDFIAQCYGTVPIAHRTGGLLKISHLNTGYLYNSNSPVSLAMMIARAISVKEYNPALHDKIIQNGFKSVKNEFLWKNVIEKKYLPFFSEILKKSENLS